MSRVVRFHSLGGPDVLRLEEREVPEPGAGEVLINVEAIGLNRADVMFRTGRYLEKATFPSQMGFEASGTVLALGSGVEGVRVGDAVGVLPGFDLSKYGTYADHAVIPQAHVLPQPQGLTSAQAAGLWMAYLTAYGGLIEAGRLTAGDWVVISAASSSVDRPAGGCPTDCHHINERHARCVDGGRGLCGHRDAGRTIGTTPAGIHRRHAQLRL